MTGLNIKDFLIHGAFLQVGPDLFKVLIGPFFKHNSVQEGFSEHSTLLYKPNFWDFLDKSPNLSQKAVYSGNRAYLLDREEFIAFLITNRSTQPNIEWKNINEAQFQSQYEWSQKNFHDRTLSKAVPILRQLGSGNFSSENLVWCIQNLIKSKTFGWSYGFFENNSGVLGHTPEVLAQWSKVDRILHTVALAGTYLKTAGSDTEMLLDQKILNEHQIVIDDIVDKLNGVSQGAKCIQGSTDILELKYLLHLMTEFQIEISDVEQVIEVITALHPTSAMGVYPNHIQKLKEFSEFSLQQERDSFAAPFAIIERDSVCCVVAIRNVLFQHDLLEIFSGCGVTPESQYDLELSELKNKRDSVKKMLGLLND